MKRGVPSHICFVLAVGLLWLAASLPVSAQGTIRYVPNFNLPMTPQTYSWSVDLDGNGTTDFRFESDGRGPIVYPTVGAYILALGELPPDLGSLVAPLEQGVEIGSFDYQPLQWFTSEPFLGGFIGSTLYNCSDQGCSGLLVFQETFLGLQFQIDGETHYGWASFSWSQLKLTEYAYNTLPNQPILAGQVPEPSTWAMLIGGGFGLLLLRRRKRSN